MNVRAFKLRPIADFFRRSTASRVGWGALASIPGLALAGPSGENMVGGSAAISRPNATHTQVDQSSQNAIVNWGSFSVDSDEYVIFNQPGTTSSILNRVVGSQQSSILGQIQANGRVYLVNPQGIYFAQGAKVDVGSFTASTLDISNNDFMSGNYVFTRPHNAVDGATVENAGEINVADGGYVVLAGDYANNTGVISARLGSVVLAAGNQMTLELSNDGLVSFAVDEATVSGLAGANNTGQILADGGQIIMTAKVANDLVATAVNNDGLLQAHRFVEHGGEIYLTASGGDIVNTGTIDVNAEGGHSGGHVDILSDENITLTADSLITANGDGAGNGGVVNVIADGTLAFRKDADIFAAAGDSGERGGVVEVSGHGGLVLKGDVSLGAGGELLVDPGVVQFSNGPAPSSSYGYGSLDVIGTQFVEGQLNVGTSVIVRASNEINAAAGGTGITALGSGALRLQIAGPSGSLVSNGDIDLPGFIIDINGNFIASAGTQNGNVTLGQVSANNVNIQAGSVTGDVAINSGMTAIVTGFDSALIDVDAGGSITINGPTIATGFESALIDADAGGSITINGPTMVTGSVATLSLSAANGNINVNGAIGVSAKSNAKLRAIASQDANFVGITRVNEAGSGLATALYGIGGDAVLDANTVDGYHADLMFDVGGDLTLKGNQNVTAARSALLDAIVGNNLDVLGDVTINEAGSGHATALYEYGNKGKFGKHTITGNNASATFGSSNTLDARTATFTKAVNAFATFGSSNTLDARTATFTKAVNAFATFRSSNTLDARTATFTKAVVVNGVSNEFIKVGVRESIKTVGAGILQADVVDLLANNNGTTNIDVKTKTRVTKIKNIGLTSNVKLDNRAFAGPSTIDFGPGAAVKSATFLANGSLTVDGPFIADRLAVGVTNGSVTFNDQVFISGIKPFPFTAPDVALFTAMGLFGLDAPNRGPNVQILAKSGININKAFIVGGPSPFTKMFTDGRFNISGLTVAGDNLLAVFSPINLDRNIIFNNTPVGTSAFSNFPTIQNSPNTDGVTFVLGKIGPDGVPLHRGSVTIGQNGSIDIGKRNMFIISHGAVSGDDLVSTNGVFEIIGVAKTDFFQVPTNNEIQVPTNNEISDNSQNGDDDGDDEDDVVAIGDGDNDDDGDSEPDSTTDSSAMECST
jgi:filamentous hemagglutinin family protein